MIRSIRPRCFPQTLFRPLYTSKRMMSVSEALKILDLPKDYTSEIVRATRKKLAFLYHPDVNTNLNASELMKSVNRAADLLLRSCPENNLRETPEEDPSSTFEPDFQQTIKNVLDIYSEVKCQLEGMYTSHERRMHFESVLMQTISKNYQIHKKVDAKINYIRTLLDKMFLIKIRTNNKEHISLRKWNSFTLDFWNSICKCPPTDIPKDRIHEIISPQLKEAVEVDKLIQEHLNKFDY